MRFLVLTKRQYTGRDLLDDRYGRLYEIPRALAAAGHRVRGLAMSYRPRPSAPPDAAGWESLNAPPFSPLGAARHLRRIRQLCREFRPDLVWASSDAWHAIAAWRTCVPAGIPYVVDLYDNYESFGLSRPPGVIPLLRRACRAADGLTLVSRTLADHVENSYSLPPGQPHRVLGNAVATALFRPLDRQSARRELGLPEDAVLIGTAGALDASRGIATLLEAAELLAAAHPSLRLALAGPHGRQPRPLRAPADRLPRHPGAGTRAGVLERARRRGRRQPGFGLWALLLPAEASGNRRLRRTAGRQPGRRSRRVAPRHTGLPGRAGFADSAGRADRRANPGKNPRRPQPSPQLGTARRRTCRFFRDGACPFRRNPPARRRRRRWARPSLGSPRPVAASPAHRGRPAAGRGRSPTA